MPSRRLRPVLALAALAPGLLAACGGAGDHVDSSAMEGSAAPAATSATAVAPPAPSTTGGTTAPAAGASIAVPVTTEWVTDTDPRVVVQISVGGGSLVPVILDTGSSGLVLDQSAAGPDVTPDPDGATFTEDYVNSSASGTVATAIVSINGMVSTAAPIEVGLVDTNGDLSMFSGTRGIMGIGAELDGDSSTTRFAPQLQLPAPYDQGSTLAVSQSGPGTWTLGPVPAVPGAVSVPLQPATAPATYPDGAPAFAKDVQLCWTIGNVVNTCGTTDLDTGAPRGMVDTTVYPGVQSGSAVPAGQPVAVSTPDGQALWSFTTGTTPGQDELVVDSLGSTTTFNTGLAFLFGRTVAFDYAGARLLIGSAT